jgi:hypothetical protein
MACALAVALLSPLAGASADSAPAPRAAADLLPGMYGLEQLGASVQGTSQVRFYQRRPCAQVMDTLQAGQWRINLFAEPQKGLDWYAGTMSYGDRIAMLFLVGSGASCAGTVTAEIEQPVTGTGDLEVSGSARAVSFFCQVGPDPNGKDMKDLRLSYVGLYRAASSAFLLMASGPATKGTHKIVPDESGDGGVTVIPIEKGADPISVMTTFLGGMYGGQAEDDSGDESGGSADDMPEGVVGMYNGPGTLEVESSTPLAATVSGSDLLEQMTQHGKLSLRAGIGCVP